MERTSTIGVNTRDFYLQSFHRLCYRDVESRVPQKLARPIGSQWSRGSQWNAWVVNGSDQLCATWWTSFANGSKPATKLLIANISGAPKLIQNIPDTYSPKLKLLIMKFLAQSESKCGLHNTFFEINDGKWKLYFAPRIVRAVSTLLRSLKDILGNILSYAIEIFFRNWKQQIKISFLYH